MSNRVEMEAGGRRVTVEGEAFTLDRMVATAKDLWAHTEDIAPGPALGFTAERDVEGVILRDSQEPIQPQRL